MLRSVSYNRNLIFFYKLPYLIYISSLKVRRISVWSSTPQFYVIVSVFPSVRKNILYRIPLISRCKHTYFHLFLLIVMRLPPRAQIPLLLPQKSLLHVPCTFSPVPHSGCHTKILQYSCHLHLQYLLHGQHGILHAV